MNVVVNETIDAKGLACPMPIMKTKKAIEGMKPGEVLELQATDKGSVADIQGWAKITGHLYLGTVEENGIFRHYLRKADLQEVKEENQFPHTITNEGLEQKIQKGGRIVILDVREPAEYAFGHIAGAISIPLGELEARLDELNDEDDIYVICRTGNRSDFACQLLREKGFKKIHNVVPGMSGWSGSIEKF